MQRSIKYISEVVNKRLKINLISRQEKRQEGKNKGGNMGKKKWTGAERETFHPNPSNLCANRGGKTEWKTEGRTKERNREWVPNPAAPDNLVTT